MTGILRILIYLVYLLRMLADILDFVTDYPYCWVHFWVVPFIRLWPYFSDILVLLYGLDDEVWSNRDLEGSHLGKSQEGKRHMGEDNRDR